MPSNGSDQFGGISVDCLGMPMRALLPFVLVILVGCANLPTDVVYQNPTLSHRGTSLSQISLQAISLNTRVRVDNPNPYRLPLRSLAGEVFYQGQSLVAVKTESGLDLPAQGASETVLNWAVALPELMSVAGSAARQSSLNLELRLTATVEVPLLGLRSWQWSQPVQVPVPRPPTASVTGWAIDVESLTELVIRLGFKVTNPNSFPLASANGQVWLSQQGEPWVTASVPALSLPAGGEAETAVQLSIDASKLGLALLPLVQQRRWPEDWQVRWQGGWSNPDFDVALPWSGLWSPTAK